LTCANNTASSEDRTVSLPRMFTADNRCMIDNN
jgi:hypothetical protein